MSSSPFRSMRQAPSALAHIGTMDPTRRRSLVIGAWVAGLLAFIALAFAAHASPTFPGDVGLTVAVQKLRLPFIEGAINLASDANWPVPAGVISIGTLVVLAVTRHFRAALCLAFSAYADDFANIMINGAVGRPRPNNIEIHSVVHVGLHSFPSGHVSHSVTFYGFLLFLSIIAWREHTDWHPWLRVVQVICGFFLICVGISRVLEGEHWPSDVLGGYMLGGLILTVAIALYQSLPDRSILARKFEHI